MPATIDLAHAGGTTGEWAAVLREVFGEYRAPDRRGRARPAAGGVGASRDGRRAGARRCPAGRPASWWPSPASTATPTAPSRSPWPPATPGMEVIYQGIRLTPEQIAAVGPRRGRRRRSACRSCRAATSSSCPRSCGSLRARASTRRWSSAASSPRRTGPAARGRASPPSTRRRTSSSPGSWARSSTSPKRRGQCVCDRRRRGRHRAPRRRRLHRAAPVAPSGFDLGRIELADAAGAVSHPAVWVADTDAELQRG